MSACVCGRGCCGGTRASSTRRSWPTSVSQLHRASFLRTPCHPSLLHLIPSMDSHLVGLLCCCCCCSVGPVWSVLDGRGGGHRPATTTATGEEESPTEESQASVPASRWPLGLDSIGAVNDGVAAAAVVGWCCCDWGGAAVVGVVCRCMTVRRTSSWRWRSPRH